MRLGRFSVSDWFIHDSAEPYRKRELFALSVIFTHLIILEARHNELKRQYCYLAMSLDDAFEEVEVDVSQGVLQAEVPEYTAVFYTDRSALGMKSVEFKFHRLDSPSLPWEAKLPAHNPSLRPHNADENLHQHPVDHGSAA